MGINPSNREFVDRHGRELGADDRRLPTLASLDIPHWLEANGGHIRKVIDECERYFERNPYRLWFDVLERMLAVGGYSFYGGERACHLDLVAFATQVKWGTLEKDAQGELIIRGRRAMAEIIRDSFIRVLVLNGRSVVKVFEDFSDTRLEATSIPEWTLPRARGKGVTGIAYSGSITSIAGVELDREVKVFGYNHNLQSSFGVTSAVMRSIGQKVGNAVASTN